MTSKRKKKEVEPDVGLWNPIVEHVFVTLMEAEVGRNSLKSFTFEAMVWQKFVDDMKLQVGRTFSVRQLKDKHSRLRIKWREFENVKNQSGLGWDEENQTVTCESDVWNTYVKAHPGAKNFRLKGLANYDALKKIYQLSTTQGLLSRASTQMPLDSDEEQRVDDKFANPDIHVVDLGDEGDDAPVSKGNCRRSSGQSSGRPTKSPRSSRMDICMDAITSTSIAKAEVLKYQVARHQRQQVVEDPYSMANCMKIIRTMTGIQSAQFFKAIDMFAK